MNTAQQLQLEKQRHSLAHILAYAVKRLYPDTKIGIGPVTDTGFYYEFDCPHTFSQDDLHPIEEEMRKIISEELSFSSIIIPREQALQTLLQLGETYKTDLLSKIPDTEVSFYKTGEDFIDLCRGPHVKNTKELDHFQLTKISKSHWMNDATRPMMQKIYGVSFESKKKLEDYIINLKKLQNINSLKVAERLGLITIDADSELSSPIYLARGITLLSNLELYVRSLMSENGIQMMSIPVLSTHKGLFEKDFSSFATSHSLPIENRKRLIYLQSDIHGVLLERLLKQTDKLTQPMSIGTVSKEHTGDFIKTDEKSSKLFENFSEETHALSITVGRMSQSKEVIINHIRLIGNLLRAFRFNQFKVILETPDYGNLSNYLYKESDWDLAISNFKDIITELKIPSSIREGKAEFYGPKISIEVKDKYSRNWQIGQIVLDLSLPKHYELSKKFSGDGEAIFFLHTFVLNSVERLLDLIFENGDGDLPLWLNPHQVEIIPLESKYLHIAVKVNRELREQGISALLDTSNDSADKRIANALSKHIPYIIIIGEKEANTEAISVKTSSGQDLGLMRTTEFIQKVKTEVKQEVDS